MARGLARNVQYYQALLTTADATSRGDLDGRGALSTKALTEFCEFILSTCSNQIDYMFSLLEPEGLLRHMQLHTEDEVQARALPKCSFPMLREVLLEGAVPRGRAGEITGYDAYGRI